MLHYSKLFGIIQIVVAMVTIENMLFYLILINLCVHWCILVAVSKATQNLLLIYVLP